MLSGHCLRAARLLVRRHGGRLAPTRLQDCRRHLRCPLAALAADLQRAAPDLLKPNAEELAGLAGVTAESLESAVHHGDAAPVVAAARRLIDRGWARCWPPSGRPGRCWSTPRRLAGDPTADPASQHRRCRRLVTGRLRARRGGRGGQPRPAADGGRLWQRCRGAARIGDALPGTDQSRRRGLTLLAGPRPIPDPKARNDESDGQCPQSSALNWCCSTRPAAPTRIR